MNWDNIPELDRQLLTIQDLAFADPKDWKEDLPRLMAFLDSSEPRACWAASWALDRRWDDTAAEPVARAIARTDFYPPVLARLKGTETLYGLLKWLHPVDEQWESQKRAWRIAEALAHAYDERVEAALMEILAEGPRTVADRTLLPLLTHATGAVLTRAVALGLQRSPYTHCWPLASQVARPGLDQLFTPHLLDEEPRIRKAARDLRDRFQKLEAPERYIPWPPQPHYQTFSELWNLLQQPGTSAQATRELRHLLTFEPGKLSTENLETICGMRETYLYRYEFFPAGYEYDAVFDIVALDTGDIIDMARDELVRREKD